MKKRLDHLLVSLALCESRSKAQSLIEAGLVLANKKQVKKPSQLFPENTKIEILPSARFVSRGGIKLQGALDHFSIDIKNQTVLDVGASTGGFTDCLLQNGAHLVYCIDVGKNQLHKSLQQHPQVIWKESFHVDELRPETFGIKFRWIVMDLSFISIKKIMHNVVRCLENDGQMLVLFKPQFEVERKHNDRGVVKDPVIRQNALEDMVTYLQETYNFSSIKSAPCVIKGPQGNQESFLWIQT
ncbi:MAG: TlyA family RNA methyltransferase [Bdellovibrionales bacterium]|nr:TlyA family RNA methyltransferase [Bdellovibrionales bacterium]